MTDLKAAAQAVADAFANPNAKANLNGRTLHLFDCLTELRKALARQRCSVDEPGDVQTQQCTLHEARFDYDYPIFDLAAIQAKTAEAKLAQQEQERVIRGLHSITNEDRGVLTLCFADESSAEAFMVSHTGDAEVAMIQRAALAEEEQYKQTVLRQALEALEHMCENTTARNTYNATKVADAMMGLTSALQGKEFSPAEIVFINEAWLHRRAAGLTQEEKMFMCGGTVVRLSPEQAAALTQQEQEPVARVLQTVGQYHTGRFVAEVETVRRLRDGENLWTHPPRRHWVSLTDEEIQTIVNKVATGAYQTSDTFARAVEQALKERNQ